MAGHLHASWKALRMLAHVLQGMWTVAWRFPKLDALQQQAAVQRWSNQLLHKAGIALEVHGQPAPQGPVLLVANHISWLDIPVMHAARFCRFVSKDDVRSWPLIGPLATAAGTLYISRNSRRDARRMVQTMAQSLEQGDVLAVFPEGTTGDGLSLLPFHSNLLQSAVEADAAVQPVALRFVGADQQVSVAPSYAGDTSLLTSIWRTLRADGLVAQVHYGAMEWPQGRDRRKLSADIRQRIAEMAQLPA